jgi:lipopolysaccharide transport system permease protein
MDVYGDLFRYRELFSNLFRRDLQAKYKGSVLGVAWSFVTPIMLMGIYFLVFSVIWHQRFEGLDHYALFLRSGLVGFDEQRAQQHL